MTQSGEETPEQKAAREKQSADKTSRINQMKGEASRTSDLADKLARGIPGQGGMSVSDFKNKWVPSFETGHVSSTPDPGDDQLPYGDDFSRRPKVRILSEGQSS